MKAEVKIIRDNYAVSFYDKASESAIFKLLSKLNELTKQDIDLLLNKSLRNIDISFYDSKVYYNVNVNVVTFDIIVPTISDSYIIIYIKIQNATLKSEKSS